MTKGDLIIGEYYEVDGRKGKLLKWVSGKKVKLKMEFSTLICDWNELENL